MPKDQIQEDKESEPRSDRNYAKRPSMKLSAQNLYKPSTPTKLYEEDSESQKDNVNFRNVITHTLVSGSFKSIAIQKNFNKKINEAWESIDISSISPHILKGVEMYQK